MNSFEDLIESDPLEASAANQDTVPVEDTKGDTDFESVDFIDDPASGASEEQESPSKVEQSEPPRRTPEEERMATDRDDEDTNRTSDVDEESDYAEENYRAEVQDRDEEDVIEEVEDEWPEYLAVFEQEDAGEGEPPDDDLPEEPEDTSISFQAEADFGDANFQVESDDELGDVVEMETEQTWPMSTQPWDMDTPPVPNKWQTWDVDPMGIAMGAGEQAAEDIFAYDDLEVAFVQSVQMNMFGPDFPFAGIGMLEDPYDDNIM